MGFKLGIATSILRPAVDLLKYEERLAGKIENMV